MPGKFFPVYIQIVLALKGKGQLIHGECKDELHKYISGITNGKYHKDIIVHSKADTNHANVGGSPSIGISALVRKTMVIANYH